MDELFTVLFQELFEKIFHFITMHIALLNIRPKWLSVVLNVLWVILIFGFLLAIMVLLVIGIYLLIHLITS
jgi:hypothetical protein